MNRSSSSDGFMMSELLVSLAIISLAFLVLFELKRDLHQRQAIQLARLDALTNEANGLSLLRRIDPVKEPVGERSIGQGSTLRWKAVQAKKQGLILQWRGRQTPHKVTLFAVDYVISRNGKQLVQGQVELIGRKITGRE